MELTNIHYVLFAGPQLARHTLHTQHLEGGGQFGLLSNKERQRKREGD